MFLITILEDEMFKLFDVGVEVSLERALLIASGLETERDLAEYLVKLDELQSGFEKYYKINKPKKMYLGKLKNILNLI